MRWITIWVIALLLASVGAHAAPNTGKVYQLVCLAVMETVLQQDNGTREALLAASMELDSGLRSKVLTLTTELGQITQWVRPDEPLSSERLAAFSSVLNDVLKALQPPPGKDLLNDLPERVEFLSMLYVARNEIGALRPARELQGSYLRLDITELAQGIDHDMQQLEQQPSAVQLKNALQRWSYIRNQFLHYKTQQPSSLSVSVQSRYISAALRDVRMTSAK